MLYNKKKSNLKEAKAERNLHTSESPKLNVYICNVLTKLFTS